MTQLDTATSLRDRRDADALVSEIPPTPPPPSPAHYRRVQTDQLLARSRVGQGEDRTSGGPVEAMWPSRELPERARGLGLTVFRSVRGGRENVTPGLELGLRASCPSTTPAHSSSSAIPHLLAQGPFSLEPCWSLPMLGLRDLALPVTSATTVTPSGSQLP